jgi:hypothetical protein
MRKQIEKQIIKEVGYALDELDIDGMVKKLVSNKAVNDAVKQAVKEKLAQIIQEKAFMKIQKSIPLIDAWTNEKVQEFLYGLGIKP